MRDLTEALEAEIAKAIHKFREAVEAATEVLHNELQTAHQTYEVASSVRIAQAHKAMAEQITAFLGRSMEELRQEAKVEPPPSTKVTLLGKLNQEL